MTAFCSIMSTLICSSHTSRPSCSHTTWGAWQWHEPQQSYQWPSIPFPSPSALGDLRVCPGAPLPLPPCGSSWATPPDGHTCTGQRPLQEAEPIVPKGLQTPSLPADTALTLCWTSWCPGSPCSTWGQVSGWGGAQTHHLLASLILSFGSDIFFFHSNSPEESCVMNPQQRSEAYCALHHQPLKLGRGATGHRKTTMKYDVETPGRKSAVWIWSRWIATVLWTSVLSTPLRFPFLKSDQSAC